RISCQCAGDFQAALVAVGQGPGNLVGVLGNAYVIQQLVGTGLDLFFFLTGSTVTQHRPKHACTGADVAADHDVFQGRQAAEQADVLEGTCKTGFSDLMGFAIGQVAACKGAAARLGDVQACHH